MKLIFFSNKKKFDINFKNGIKIAESIFAFSDNCV